MLYNLDWLKEGKPFPPLCEKPRLRKYLDNEVIFENDCWALHNDVFNQAAARITRVIGNFESYISFPVLFNFQRLLSLKTADLVAGEYPTITSGTEEGNEVINEIRSFTDFDNKLYSTVIDLSRFGDAIWRKYKSDDEGKYTFCSWTPMEWFPIVSQDGTYQEIKQVLAWPAVIGPEENRNYELHVQVHERGLYTFYRFQLSAASICRRALLDGSATIGRLLEKKVVRTGLKENAVVHLKPYSVTGTIYGDDDYTPITSIVTELMVRISQISNILDKHADPALAGPASMLRTDPDTGELYFEKGKFYAIQGAESPPQYITWNGQLDSAFKECEFLINQLYILSEMGAAILGANDGGSQAVSGNALRLKMVNPLAKVRRISNNMTKSVKELFVSLSTSGFEKALEFKDISVSWKDGLPNDPREQTELIKLLTGESKIMPLQDALEAHLNLSPSEARRWIASLTTTTTQNKEDTFNEESNRTSSVDEEEPSGSPSLEGESTGPGSKTGVNPRKKGSILEPHLTGTQNTNSSRDRR